jgi:hypothetical protein
MQILTSSLSFLRLILGPYLFPCFRLVMEYKTALFCLLIGGLTSACCVVNGKSSNQRVQDVVYYMFANKTKYRLTT